MLCYDSVLWMKMSKITNMICNVLVWINLKFLFREEISIVVTILHKMVYFEVLGN